MDDTLSRVTDRARGIGMSPRHLGAVLLIAAGYYLGARLGFAMTLDPVPVSTLWPPNAILLAGLLLTPRRSWPLILTAVFGAHLAVQFQSGVPTGMVLCWYVSNCVEALLGATLLRRFGGVPTFDTFRGTVVFLACAGFAGPFVSSFLDAAFVMANGWGDSSYWTVWRTRMLSNVLATITLVPVILTSVPRIARWARIPRRAYLESLIGLGALTAVCLGVFALHQSGPGASPALLYTPLPLLVGAAVRFGPWGASTSMLLCTVIAIWGAGRHLGPFVSSSPAENAVALQLFLIVTWIPIMSLAAVVRERTDAEAKVRESEAQLTLAIDAAQLGRWEWDIVRQELTWSDVTRRMYEVPLDAPVGLETFEALIHPDDRHIIATATADGLNGREFDIEFRVVFPDGRIKWIQSKGRVVFDLSGRPVRIVGVKVDVTQRKTAEQQLHQKQRNLAYLSRVTVAGELSVALSHQLNQPLAAILANASAARRFLLHDPPDLRELGEIVEAIAADNRRAAAIITQFGSRLRTDDSRWARLEINDVVAGVIDLARADVISREVSLTTYCEDGLPQIVGDPVQLQQVVLNLIVNACDAMETVAPGARRLIVKTGSDDRGGVRVTVNDSGPGVGFDRMDQIFEPFVTSKPQRLGLGLAICRSIMASHDGMVSLESRPGQGATFWFSLPSATFMNSAERYGSPTRAET